MAKEYLGDSVYVDFDGHQLVLTTENNDGRGATNTIYMDGSVLQALYDYVTRLKEIPCSTPDLITIESKTPPA